MFVNKVKTLHHDLSHGIRTLECALLVTLPQHVLRYLAHVSKHIQYANIALSLKYTQYFVLLQSNSHITVLKFTLLFS